MKTPAVIAGALGVLSISICSEMERVKRQVLQKSSCHSFKLGELPPLLT
jgi:hypothetical protein